MNFIILFLLKKIKNSQSRMVTLTMTKNQWNTRNVSEHIALIIHRSREREQMFTETTLWLCFANVNVIMHGYH